MQSLNVEDKDLAVGELLLECRFVCLFLEYAEQTAAASAHLCVCRSHVIKSLFDDRQFGMVWEDAFLEVVCQSVAPCLDGLRDMSRHETFGFCGWMCANASFVEIANDGFTTTML